MSSKRNLKERQLETFPNQMLLLKYEISYQNCQFLPHLRTHLSNMQTRDDLATKLFHMWSGHVFNMPKTWFQLHLLTFVSVALAVAAV